MGAAPMTESGYGKQTQNPANFQNGGGYGQQGGGYGQQGYGQQGGGYY